MAHRDTQNHLAKLSPSEAERRRDYFAHLHIDRGLTLQKIADNYGISRQRVHQIVSRWRQEFGHAA